MKLTLSPKPIIALSDAERQRLGRWHAGVIETRGGRLIEIRWLPWPRRITQFGVWWDCRRNKLPDDTCLLFWHRSWLQRKVLALDYVRSGQKTSVATFHSAVRLLDEVARSSNALVSVCHVTNQRISERLLMRWGWERHCLEWSGRHYIRRYYSGEYL